MTTTILASRNLEWGYWGTLARIENDPAADPAKAWAIASRRIAEATTASPEGVRDFLDSRHGRHFADDVAGELARGDTLASPETRQRVRDRDPHLRLVPVVLGGRPETSACSSPGESTTSKPWRPRMLFRAL